MDASKTPLSEDTQVEAIAPSTQKTAAKTEIEHKETIEEAYAHQLVEQGERYMVAVDGSKQSGKAFKWVLKQAAMAKDPSKVEVVIINFLPECDFAVEVSEDYQRAKHELSACLEEYKRILSSVGVPICSFIFLLMKLFIKFLFYFGTSSFIPFLKKNKGNWELVFLSFQIFLSRLFKETKIFPRKRKYFINK